MAGDRARGAIPSRAGTGPEPVRSGRGPVLGGAQSVTALFAILLAACADLGPPIPATAPAFVPEQLIVGYRPGASPAERAALRADFGVQGHAPLGPESERWLLPAGADPEALAGRIPGLRYAQPNFIRRIRAYSAAEFNDGIPPKDNQLWHLALIGISRAWNIGTLKTFSTEDPPGQAVIVAVVDSGVDVRHPDLAANILKDAGGQPRFLDELRAVGRTDLLADPASASTTYGYDWETAYLPREECAKKRPGATDCPGPDGNGHGTHVAGIIAATGNNLPGVQCSDGPCNTVGVGPGIAILPVKTMDALGNGDDYTIARGLRDAADAGARVINLSVGGPQPGPALEEAIEYLSAKGALLVVASGNNGLGVNYPAAYPGVLAVGAVGHPADPAYPEAEAKGAPYSSSGPELDLVAPGGSDTSGCPESQCGVFSTVPTYPSSIALRARVRSTGYGRLAGTSMAAPQVSATAALLLAREPGLTPGQIRARLISTASRVLESDGPFSERYGYGLLDPLKALSTVSHDGS